MNASKGNLKKPETLLVRLLRSLYTSRFSDETIAVVYLLSMLFNAGFFLQLMMMPYVAEQLGITISQLGIAQSIAGLLQVAGSFISGLIATKYSTSLSLNICYSSAILSQLLIFFATNRTMLYLGLLSQIFMNGQQCDMRMLTKLTKPGKERTEAFSKMGFTFGLKKYVGIGFLLSTVLSITAIKTLGENSVFVVAAITSVIELILFNSYIAERLDMKTENGEGDHKEKKLSLSNLVRLGSNADVLNTYICKAMLIGPTMFTMSIIQIYLINYHNISSTTNSLIQAYIGLLFMFSNGFVVPLLRRYYTESKVFILGTMLLVLGNVLLIKANIVWFILLLIFFLCLGMALSGTTADSLITAAVDKGDEELVVGAIVSTDTLTRALAPGISGYLLENFGLSIFGVIGSIFALIVAIKNFTVLQSFMLGY